MNETTSSDLPLESDRLAEATFAGGCFWCMEGPFERLDGVEAVVSGYAGGEEENPSYEDVARGRTSHRESVRILFDPEKVSFAELLITFFEQIDPTDPGGQFADRGEHYATAVFYHDAEQKRLAEGAIAALEASGVFDEPIVVRVLPFSTFYAAEEYHQDYYKKNTRHYENYKRGSGRAGFIERFGKPQTKVLREWVAGSAGG